MSDFGFEEGISNQNAMTSEAIRANRMSEDIRKRTIDELQRTLNSNLSTLNQQERNDEVVSGSRDLFTVGNDIGQFYSMYQDINKAGGFKAYLRGAGAGDRLSLIAGGMNKGLTGVGSGLSDLRNTVANSNVGNFIRGGGGEVTERARVGVRDVLGAPPLRSQDANLTLIKPQDATTTAPLTSQVQNPARDEAQGTNRPPANESVQEGTEGARSSTAGSGAPAVEETEETVTESDKLASRLNEGIDRISKATDTISTVNKVAGTAMGITSGITDIVKITDGDYKKMNGWDQASDIAGIVSGGIDAVSLALPFLAPIGALSGAIEAVTGTVGELKDVIGQKNADQSGAQKDEKQANALAQSQVVSPILASQGMIASRTMDNTAQIRPSSSF